MFPKKNFIEVGGLKNVCLSKIKTKKSAKVEALLLYTQKTLQTLKVL